MNEFESQEQQMPHVFGGLFGCCFFKALKY